jgi:protein-disulfide isomerase
MSTKKSKAAERAERAAALLREQRARERRRNLITGGVVVAVLAALVVVGLLISRSSDVDTSLAHTEAGGSDYGVTIGDADAPHTLVIYEDFLCPGCGQLEEQSNEQLQELADEGNVYVDYRPFNLLSRLGDYSARSASAFGVVLEESGPEVAKEFHDLLFADQPEEGDEPYPDADWLVEKAVEAGATEAEVRPGIEEGATDFAEEATQEAEDAGVSGTPTVILDGEIFNGSVDELLAELE